MTRSGIQLNVLSMAPKLQNERVLPEVFVGLKGECPKCHASWFCLVEPLKGMTYAKALKSTNTVKAQYGHLTRRVSECLQCKHLFYPAELIMFDSAHHEISVKKVKKEAIELSEPEAETERARQQLRDHYEQNTSEFWLHFGRFALDNWDACLTEVSFEEFSAFYKISGERPPRTPVKSSLESMRSIYLKDIRSRKTTDEDKLDFWRKATVHYVEQFVRGTIVAKLGKPTGRYRMRELGVFLCQPMPESLESFRWVHLGEYQKLLKDQKTPLRHIGYALRQMRETSLELANTQEKLRAERARTESLRQQVETLEEKQRSATEAPRSVEDRRKIKALQEMIRELRQELASLPEPESSEAPRVLEEDNVEAMEEYGDALGFLKGKTITIIGSYQKRHSDSAPYGCHILTHDGLKMDDEIMQKVKSSDIVILLPPFIRHRVMWDVKEWCILNDTPCLFEKSVNLYVLLSKAVKSLAQ